jgi:hypothetical protein
MTVIANDHGERVDTQTAFVPVGPKFRFDSGIDVDLSRNVEVLATANGTGATAQENLDGTGRKEETRWDS